MPEKKEDRASFMDRFVLRIRPKDMEKLDLAYDLAKHGHRNQFRENGERYFEHVRSTALILVDEFGITDVELIISALLHDMLEDSFLLNNQRIQLFCGPRVSRIVTTITKPKKDNQRFANSQERLDFYHQQVKNGETDAKLVKLADRLHNVRTLDNCSEDKIARKLVETKNEYLPLIEDVIVAYPKLGAKLKEAFAEEIAKFETPT